MSAVTKLYVAEDFPGDLRILWHSGEAHCVADVVEVEYVVNTINGEKSPMTGEHRVLRMSIKWDGCVEIELDTHACSGGEVKNLLGVIEHIYRNAHKYIECGHHEIEWPDTEGK